ncbi:sulfatase : Uncharacterized protein OS=Blastopirellula marina DSM 3645 GN=DSM3645_26474 PE=4 SV=1: DUF1501 [Gemmata massiliana]|uniref:Sulfatase n=1 Tax=Gemmata massiliana TaxID=1210884 RepID=A0A6P2D0W4_9BACT|nr:DUF1501 domain-containing protein [Gemmata massiliana]VTR94763.1 sulfatase : Uncharacterized protein OS=Blastopirellula marina DSM 3645 GN=DSM3645_26474 PE=4 SV=1: DUF1501 [Gemmata massiliana]
MIRPDLTDPFGPTRRQFIRELGGSVGLLGLASYLRATEPSTAPVPTVALGKPHFKPRAKRVIFLFMAGGPSHLDMFDPKPVLAQHTGQRPGAADLRTERVTGGLLPSAFKFRPGGKSGLPVSDLLPNIRECADELCVLRGVHAINPNHSPAANFLASGRIDAVHPGIGSWVSYGLGSENADLPGFVSLGGGFGQAGFERSGYLPGQFQATRVAASETDPEKMIRHLRNPNISSEDQKRQLEALQSFNRTHATANGNDPQLEARIRAMETAFRMQSAAGEAFDVRRETVRVREAYGNGEFARGCLLARRLVERGVRFVQLSIGGWDHHAQINSGLKKLCGTIDQPIAALLRDLRQRGLLDDTLVVWGGEFGRTPVSENGDGRDHNHYGFTVWMAGGGVKAGTTYGATDEFGFKATEGRVSVHDLHATILHMLGLDHEKLTYRYSGRDFRLTDVHGRIVNEILA